MCAGFITVSVKKLLHYRAGGLLQYRVVLLHYRAVITLSGVFYYIIGQLLQYRAFITLSVGTTCILYMSARVLSYLLLNLRSPPDYVVRSFVRPSVRPSFVRACVCVR